MKTLIHNQIKDNIPSNSSRNGYGYVEYTDAINTDSSNQDSSSTITFNHDELDSKRIPFTIRMLSPGKLKLLLLPDLGIQDVTFLVINGPNKLDSQTFFYDHHDVNWFETTTYSEGDEIRILVKWVSIATNRTFGVPQNFNFSAAEIGSCLMGTGKYEVFGNMGSLLFDWNDNRWIADDYSIVGNNTFKQFFMGVDTAYIDTEDTANSASQIYAEASLTSGLVSARNLYLPPLNVPYAYFKLFYGNTDIKYGPSRIHVCAKTSYCEQLLMNCYYIESDYDVFVTSSIANGENNNMRYMFGSIGSENGTTYKAGTLYYVEPNIYISYSNYMVEGASGGGVFSNYVFSPGGNIEKDYQEVGTFIGAVGATPTYKILNPIIWVDDIQAMIDEKVLGDVSEYIDRNYEGAPYIYQGTIWVSSEHQSYYLWEYISKYDTSSVSQDPYATMGTPYILTSEKDFTGMTLKETGKIMVCPVKFIALTLTQISGKTYTIDCADYIDYDLSNCTIIKQSGVIPNADAGVPVIAVDKSYNTWGEPTTINYKHFRNSQYKYFNYSEKIGYMWKLCLTQFNENSPHTIVNDDNYEDELSWISGNSKYIVTQHLNTRYNVYSKPWDLSITFLERGSEMIWAGISNYYNIEMLNRDETIYVPVEGAEYIFIITTNGIMPETCDYIIE